MMGRPLVYKQDVEVRGKVTVIIVDTNQLILEGRDIKDIIAEMIDEQLRQLRDD